jgi:hypothetical protein
MVAPRCCLLSWRGMALSRRRYAFLAGVRKQPLSGAVCQFKDTNSENAVLAGDANDPCYWDYKARTKMITEYGTQGNWMAILILFQEEGKYFNNINFATAISKNAAVGWSFWRNAFLCHLFWRLGGFAMMACGALRHAADDLTGHGGLGQFTVLWVFAIMACSALRHVTVGLMWCLGDCAIMACFALRDAADGLTCGALRHEAGRQLLWQDALLNSRRSVDDCRGFV